jgi:serine phosphatase RsbU (regulator of sigma subunit)
VRVLEAGTGLVGAFAQSTFKTTETTLAPGEVLVMFTDGVTEARLGRELYGYDRLALALDRLRDTPLAGLPRALLNDVLEFSRGMLQDDVVIVCVSRRAEANL